jgi:hypothetical protein
MLNLYALIFFFPLLAYGQQWIVRNPVDATFRIGSSKGSPYKSIGASLYPYWVGSTDQRYTYRLMSAGKANGLSSFRAILIFEQLNGQPSVGTDNCFGQYYISTNGVIRCVVDRNNLVAD